MKIMRDHIIFFLIVILLSVSCETDHGEPFTSIRKIDENTLETLGGVYLHINFSRDTVIQNESIPSQAEAQSFFENSDTTIIRYGHCWSKVTADPTLNDSLSSYRKSPTIGDFNFQDYLINLHYLSTYWIRAYFITSTQDTAYSPVVHKFTTGHLADSWSKRSKFGTTGRKHAVSFSINDIGYIGTGESDGGTCHKDFWQYDPIADTWTQLTNLGRSDIEGLERKHAVGFEANGYGYIGIGEDKNEQLYQDFWEYDPVGNRWVGIANFYTPRSKAIGFSVDGKIYVGLGEYGSGGQYTPRSDMYVLNDAKDGWGIKADFEGGARINASIFVVGSRAFVYGGEDGSGTIENDLYEFSPTGGGALGAWYSRADLPAEARRFPVAFGLEGDGYLCLGETVAGTKLRENWQYNVEEDEWKQKNDFVAEGRIGASGFAIGYRGYLGLGYDGSDHRNDFWEYLPDSPNIGTE